ncbi:hypothetical protein GCM10020367_65630 [Streptomyces sannanensis]|uniref:Uncharacterized protein n=1 Tax=Streptomyces sannanensis TaxID=285536 RepID=A0ABP6SM97_9ACTN
MPAVPIADAGGLTGLWAALACANLLQAGSKLVSFLRHGTQAGASVPAGTPVGDTSRVEAG